MLPYDLGVMSNNSAIFSCENPFSEFAMGDCYEKYGILEGTYYESLVEFGDGTRGKLFMGASSKQYFVEMQQNLENYFGKDHFFILYLPKDIVSGDFYWAEKVRTKLLLPL